VSLSQRPVQCTMHNAQCTMRNVQCEWEAKNNDDHKVSRVGIPRRIRSTRQRNNKNERNEQQQDEAVLTVLYADITWFGLVGRLRVPIPQSLSGPSDVILSEVCAMIYVVCAIKTCLFNTPHHIPTHTHTHASPPLDSLDVECAARIACCCCLSGIQACIPWYHRVGPCENEDMGDVSMQHGHMHVFHLVVYVSGHSCKRQ
jgi:hypothetical protein